LKSFESKFVSIDIRDKLVVFDDQYLHG
jgi:hypothetical protein